MGCARVVMAQCEAGSRPSGRTARRDRRSTGRATSAAARRSREAKTRTQGGGAKTERLKRTAGANLRARNRSGSLRTGRTASKHAGNQTHQPASHQPTAHPRKNDSSQDASRARSALSNSKLKESMFSSPRDPTGHLAKRLCQYVPPTTRISLSLSLSLSFWKSMCQVNYSICLSCICPSVDLPPQSIRPSHFLPFTNTPARPRILKPLSADALRDRDDPLLQGPTNEDLPGWQVLACLPACRPVERPTCSPGLLQIWLPACLHPCQYGCIADWQYGRHASGCLAVWMPGAWLFGCLPHYLSSC